MKKIHHTESKKMKSVRIDFRTTILVDESIPDEEARQRFLTRYKMAQKAPTVFIEPVKKRKEIPVGTVEYLSHLIDDSKLPETE